jgi:HEPN domain-containing protein
MSVPRRDRIKAGERWLALADEHLRIARHAFSLKTSAPFRLIAFHAQQCAETALKGFLVANDIAFPHTHSIVRLLELARASSWWTYRSDEAEQLTPFAVVTRYALDDEPVTKQEGEHAVAAAEGILQAARMALSGLKASGETG